jgi:FkbM family methyltransferase
LTLRNPLNFLKKANKCFNLYLKDHDKIDNIISSYGDDQEKFKEFFETKSGTDKDLIAKLNRFDDWYSKKKYYFFNGEEHLFKSMDTDTFFKMCYNNNINLLAFSPSENKILLETKDGIKFFTNNRFWTIDSVFARNEYSVPHLYTFKDFIVFDIGMNRGYASLNFANFDTCSAVYGFEIDQHTYNLSLENFKLNPKLSPKIKPFNFGLFDKDDEIDLFYIPGYDGITTTNTEFAKTQSEWVSQKELRESKKAQVKEAGKIISDIIDNDNIKSNIVLKIDTEGAESKIMYSLIKEGLMEKIDLIIGEIHLETEDLESKLTGFKRIYKTQASEKIYNLCMVKEKYYKAWNVAKTVN